jgi:acetyl-CoA acetyltransferase
MDNFNCDPLGGHTMLQTAENVGAKHGIGTAEQHELVLRREEQYRMSLENDSAFLRRFMTLPFDVPTPNFKKVANSMTGDEGVSQSTPEGLAKLKPVMPGGVVTFGGQTHPADGNAAIVVTTRDKARELSADPKIAVRLHGFGLARAALAYMPEACCRRRSARCSRPAAASPRWPRSRPTTPSPPTTSSLPRQTGADLTR